jgi:hypothetical protein
MDAVSLFIKALLDFANPAEFADAAEFVWFNSDQVANLAGKDIVGLRFDVACKFVSNDSIVLALEIFFDDMYICAANSSGIDFDQDFTLIEGPKRLFDDFELVITVIDCSVIDCFAHGKSPCIGC